MSDLAPKRWTDKDLIIQIVSGVLVPISVFVAGMWYTEQQNVADKNKLSLQLEADKNAAEAKLASDNRQHDLDVLTALLNHLSSSNATERKLAATFAQGIVQEKQFSKDLLPLAFAMMKGTDPDLNLAGQHLIAQASTAGNQVAHAIQQAVMGDANTRQLVTQVESTNAGLHASLELARVNPNVQFIVNAANDRARILLNGVKCYEGGESGDWVTLENIKPDTNSITIQVYNNREHNLFFKRKGWNYKITLRDNKNMSMTYEDAKSSDIPDNQWGNWFTVRALSMVVDSKTGAATVVADQRTN